MPVPRASSTRPAPQPMVTNDRATVAVGSVVWAVLLLVALLNRDALTDAGRGWWVWSCASGLVLGLVGLAWLHLRTKRDGRPPS